MPIEVQQLKPYKSLLLAHLEEGYSNSIVDSVIGDFKSQFAFSSDPDLNIGVEKPSEIRRVELPATGRFDELEVGFLLYEERREPPWLRLGGGIADLFNHLLLVCRRDGLVAIYLSDPRRRGAIVKAIKEKQGSGFSHLELLHRRELNDAFVKGPTRTLWLEGIHPPVSVKADSKVLIGQNLRDALDPLGDQTYYFTAARSSVPELGLPIGVSARGSRVWVGPSREWDDFAVTVCSLMHHYDSNASADPMPVVALPIEQEEAPQLEKAFDLHLMAPELLDEAADIDEQKRQVMERWAYSSRFEILSAQGDCLQARVWLQNEPLATVEFQVNASDPTDVRVAAEVVGTEAPVSDELLEEEKVSREELLKELEEVTNKAGWLKIWYESGHTCSEGEIFRMRFLDLPFLNYQWEDFSRWNISLEKFWKGKIPDDPFSAIDGSDSLFSWVKAHWPAGNPYSRWRGWLACDDGAMEIADFIHLDDQRRPPLLSLVHVKAADIKTDSQSGIPKADRGLKVSAYQVVTAQALRNLRYLYRPNVAADLAKGLEHKIGQLVWHDGSKSTREKMLDALSKIGHSYQRQIIILQPQVMQSRIKAVRSNPKHPDLPALQQLDSLLLSAEASCRDVQAYFKVVADRN